VVSSLDAREALVWSREYAADVRLPSRTLVHAVALVAALRSELAHANDTYTCDGSRCERPHAVIRPSDALALGCRGYFTALAPRLGTTMLASTFASLGLTSPSVPEDPEARVRFALHGEGWSLSLDDALALARSLRAHPGPEAFIWNEALVPRFGDPGPLRGVVAMDESVGWFVGHSVGASERLVVVSLSECEGRAGTIALSAARQAFDGTVHPPRPAAPPQTNPRRARRSAG
jgi:hypothetical protein